MNGKNDINKYDFNLKKDEIKKIFNTPEYQEYKTNKNKNQKRKETVYKFTSIGNSTDIVKSLIIVNVFFFILSTYLFPSMFKYFASYGISDISSVYPWQPLTSMFLHGGIIHILLNMFVLWSFGNQLNQTLGNNKFLTLYFVSGIISGLFWLLFGTGAAVGASGALCGLMAAYVFISPESTVLLFFVLPIKIKKMVYGFAIFSLVFGILSIINPVYGFGVAHFGHLGGLIGGYVLTYFWSKNRLIRTF